MALTDEVLETGTRYLLACPGAGGPLVVPLAAWYDGEALWAATRAGAPEVLALGRGGVCAVHARSRRGAVLARGQVRVLSLRDPAGLLLRVPTITAVLAALALRDPPSLAATLRDALAQPSRWGSLGIAILHVRPSRVEFAAGGEPPPGIAPPLPPSIPADVRRALAGARRVVVARAAPGAEGGSVELAPGWWDHGYGLALPGAGARSPGGEAVAVAVDAEPGPGDGAGLVLYGRLRGGALEPDRATYWRDGEVETVEVPPARSELVLPD